MASESTSRVDFKKLSKYLKVPKERSKVPKEVASVAVYRELLGVNYNLIIILNNGRQTRFCVF